MTNKDSRLGTKLVSNTALMMLDWLVVKMGGMIAFVVLARLLSEEKIATLGIAIGYLTVIQYCDVAPIRILLRDYPEIADKKEERDKVLSALLIFWFIQAGAMLLVCGALEVMIFRKLELAQLNVLFFALTLDFIAFTWRQWVMLIFFTALRQYIATLFGFFLTLVRLSAYVVLVFLPSLETYGSILIGLACITFIAWGFLFGKAFRFRPKINRRTPGILKRALTDYGLWEHFNRISMGTLLRIDTAILSIFALNGLAEIGNYAMALTFVGMFLMIPMQLHTSLQVALANSREAKNRDARINSFIKLNTVISIGQLLIFALGGKILVRILYGQNADELVLNFSAILLIAVTILNLAWPFRSIINNLGNLKHSFLMVFLPLLVAGLGLYSVAAIGWGPWGIAYVKIGLYSTLTILLIVFARRAYNFSINYELLTLEERSLLRNLFYRMSKSIR